MKRLQIVSIHPPSPKTTGIPVEEGEKSSAATADSACTNCRADEPYEAPKRKFWSEVGSLKGTTALAAGLHLILLCSLMTTAGCVPLLVGAAAGAGGLGYVKGALTQNIDEPVDKINEATVSMLNDFGLFVVVDELNKHLSYIRAEYEDGQKVQINIEALTEYVSSITIRVGVFGDQDESIAMLNAIKKKL